MEKMARCHGSEKEHTHSHHSPSRWWVPSPEHFSQHKFLEVGIILGRRKLRIDLLADPLDADFLH